MFENVQTLNRATKSAGAIRNKRLTAVLVALLHKSVHELFFFTSSVFSVSVSVYMSIVHVHTHVHDDGHVLGHELGVAACGIHFFTLVL